MDLFALQSSGISCGEPARRDIGSHGRSSETVWTDGGAGERERGSYIEWGERGDDLVVDLAVRGARESIFRGSSRAA